MPTKKKTNTKKNVQGSSVLRQLSGAVIGGTLALGIYYTYEYGSPVVTAWLTVPQDQYTVSGTASAQKSLKEGEQARIFQRAQHIVDTFGQRDDPPPPKKGVPDNWDLDAIANTEITADEGWGGYTDEWPEPPLAREEDHGAADEWDAVWDDTWDDEFEALQNLAYSQDERAVSGDWSDTWEDPSWEGETAVPVAQVAAQRHEEYVAPTEVTPMTHSPDNLPSSGIELWLAAIVALCGVCMIHSKRIAKLVRG